MKFGYFGKQRYGFSLAELLLYLAIFAVSAVFLIGVLAVVTRLGVKQTSSAEVNQQTSFVAATIQRLVRESSLIGNPVGVPSSTLVLRTASSSADPTLIYSDVSGNTLYFKQGNTAPVRLTNNKVKVPVFTVTKYENPGGAAVVQVDFTIEYNTTNPTAKFSRVWHGAIGRVLAATIFDDHLQPNTGNSFDVGNASYQWRSGYFSGNLTIGGDVSITNGSVGIGTLAVPGAKIKSSGNITFTTSTVGIILVPPNNPGTCYRLGVSNVGGLTTTTVPCP